MNPQDLGIGKLITKDQQRDCIHMAVAPVEVAAGQTVMPGMRVGVLPNGCISRVAEPHVGVVDPFLTKPINAGQKCWLFLFPGSIKSLRHEWSHPAFKAQDKLQFTAEEQTKAASKEWLTRGQRGEYFSCGC